jgi:putative FmdB family regulatory protein
MPTYEYKCEDCGVVIAQRLSLADYGDSVLTPVCLTEVGTDANGKPKLCGGHTRRLFSPPGVSIK